MRLEQEGIEVTGVLDEDFCKIPLGLPLPKGQQRVIPFGAAASMVPCVGISFLASHRHGPRNRKTRCGESRATDELLRAGLNIIWPSSRRRTRELYMIGLEMLTRMDPKRNRDFFNAFFELPLESWRGFLDDTLTPYELGLTMSKMFALSKTGLRFSLVHNTVSHASEHLFKAVSPSFTRKERCYAGKNAKGAQPAIHFLKHPCLPQVSALMKTFSIGQRPSGIAEMAKEHLGTGGKRFRALMTLQAADLLGVSQRSAIYWAAAVELIHNATLVHDDIQDGDTTRRGRPTVWKKHGVGQAINVGDLMLMVPYQILSCADFAPSQLRQLLGAATDGGDRTRTIIGDDPQR